MDLGTDTLIGTEPAHGLIAYAEATDMGTGAGQFRVRLTCAIHPDAGAGVLSTMLDWLTGRAGQMRAERHPELAGVVSVRCAAADLARRTALAAAGFEVDHWHLELTRDTAGPVPGQPVPGQPAGAVTVIPYDARYSEAARLAQNDAFADEPHGRLLDAGVWPLYAVGLAAFLPSASFLALDAATSPATSPAPSPAPSPAADSAADPAPSPAADSGQQVVAFLLSLNQGGQGGPGGDRTATVVSLGTRGGWRGRGLATDLIGHALAAYRQAGFSTARLEVCSHNATAVTLYNKLGFAPGDRGYAIFQRSRL